MYASKEQRNLTLTQGFRERFLELRLLIGHSRLKEQHVQAL